MIRQEWVLLIFSITIHLQPKLKTTYLLSAFLDNELLSTKEFTVAGSLIMKKKKNYIS